jgi:hypothetical protein
MAVEYYPRLLPYAEHQIRCYKNSWIGLARTAPVTILLEALWSLKTNP